MGSIGTPIGIRDLIVLIIVGIFTIGLMEITRLVKHYAKSYFKMR